MYYNDVTDANHRIQELEAEILTLKWAVEYLEQDKIPWLEGIIEQQRQAIRQTKRWPLWNP